MLVRLIEEELCPSCGHWGILDEFTGWCGDCSPQSTHTIPCNLCGGPILIVNGTTICNKCKQERWLSRHSDEIEFLIVYKQYSYSQARLTVARMIRPVCNCCGRVIKGGTPGETLFCKSNKTCHAMYRKYHRLISAGVSQDNALREVTSGVPVRPPHSVRAARLAT